MPKIDYVAPDDFGIMLGKASERMVVYQNKKVLKELPLLFLRSVTVFEKGASISTDLIQKCCEYGIHINILDRRKAPVAKITAPQLCQTVEILKAQFEAVHNGKAIELCCKITENKIKNQKRLLKYFNKYQQSERIESQLSGIETCLDGVKNLSYKDYETAQASLLGYEGSASSFYWKAFKCLVQEKTNFTNRQTRGATDLVNSMLNYGYAIIYSKVWGMVMLAGLEPFCGYIHKDRSGKPSMVLDLTEMYRIIPEHTILTMINSAKAELPTEMDDKIKKDLADRVVEKVNATHQYNGKNFPMESIMQKTIRNVSMFLRGKAALDLYTYPLR